MKLIKLYLKKRNRRAFNTTDTEENDMAAAAIIGLSKGPSNI